MYLRIGRRIINANRLVHARVEGGGEVVLTMTRGEEINLRGDEAERFLQSLPTYEPVAEGE